MDDQTSPLASGACVIGAGAGVIGATSQQYPLKMAQMGVDAVVEFVETGEAPSGYVDTGVTLITDNPVEGVPSEAALDFYEASEKPYRHATYYQIPDEVGQM